MRRRDPHNTGPGWGRRQAGRSLPPRAPVQVMFTPGRETCLLGGERVLSNCGATPQMARVRRDSRALNPKPMGASTPSLPPTPTPP